MKQPSLVKILPLMGWGLFACPAVHAHEGHGLPGFAHWHSTDVLGFMAVAGAAAAALWMKGRK